MKRDDAINHAARAAAAAFQSARAPVGFEWYDCLASTPADLAEIIDSVPWAPAAYIYRQALRTEPTAKLWWQTQPEIRVAVEVFRASYLALLRLTQDEARHMEAIDG